jgi:SpoVK/Ycf46/Vps4 family AAA+-type ATPase
MQGTRMSLSHNDWQELLNRTDGYSGCDIANLISSALLEPIRDMVKATHWITTCCEYKNAFSHVRYIPEYQDITAKQTFLSIINN